MSNNLNNKFTSKLGFIATASSAAVGIGNIWRFPYLTGKYGGASFVVIYILCVFILGFPIVLAKLTFGRKMQSGTFNAYISFKPKSWSYIGLGAALTSFFMLSYYVVITGWLLGYFFKIITGNLFNVKKFEPFFSNFTANYKLITLYTVIIISVITFIVKNNINKGIEKISKVLMPVFVALMVCLIIFSLTLKGSYKGLYFYLLPNFNSFSIEAFYAALTQAFLSLSIGLGISITYGSYVSKKENLFKATTIIILSDTIVSLLAGLIIFPIIFYSNIEPNQGPALIFISLPMAFKILGPFLGKLIGSAFFAILLFAAITSAMALLEVPVKYIIERFKIKRKYAVYILAANIIFLSIPSILSQSNFKMFARFIEISNKNYSFISFIDILCAEIFAPIVALFFCIFVSKKLKINFIFNDLGITNYNKTCLFMYLKATINFICPSIVTLLIILKIWQLIK